MTIHSIPSGYLASRDEFNRRAEDLGVVPRRFLHGEEGSGDADLSTDVAYLGPAEAQTLVVIASGTHGVEGYAGAACQFRFMETYPDRFAQSGVAWLLVHAVNPWGFQHDRRVTCEGVDLNRNFVDFSVPQCIESGYGAYHRLLVADFRPLPQGWRNEIRLLSHGLTRAKRRELQAAITAGQYAYPDGLFFGGVAPAKSRLVWEKIMRAYARDRKRAVLLDIHTGLGKVGSGELISDLAPTAAGFRQLSHWFHGSLRSTVSGESVSATAAGTLTADFCRARGGERHAVVLEFGTCGPLSVLNALRADQWYHNNAARLSPAEREWARRKMKNAFTATDAEWLRRVGARFDQVVAQLAQGLAE